LIVKLGSPRTLWREPVSNRLNERKGKFIGHVLREDIVLIIDGPIRICDLDWYYVHAGNKGLGWISIPGGWHIEEVLSSSHDFLDAYFIDPAFLPPL